MFAGSFYRKPQTRSTRIFLLYMTVNRFGVSTRFRRLVPQRWMLFVVRWGDERGFDTPLCLSHTSMRGKLGGLVTKPHQPVEVMSFRVFLEIVNLLEMGSLTLF